MIVYSDKPPATGTLAKTVKVQDLPSNVPSAATIRELELLRRSHKSAPLPMSTATEFRVAGVALGCAWLLVVPGLMLGPSLFGDLPLSALPGWAPVLSSISAILGAWHLLTAAFALDEDLEALSLYVLAQDAAPLVLPYSLFAGTRSLYRRLFAPALVARRRWQARRDARSRLTASPARPSPGPHDFPDTWPMDP